MNRPVGRITRGTTGSNRLRRFDRWITYLAEREIRSDASPLSVDLGFGSAPTTTAQWQRSLRRVNPASQVVGSRSTGTGWLLQPESSPPSTGLRDTYRPPPTADQGRQRPAPVSARRGHLRVAPHVLAAGAGAGSSTAPATNKAGSPRC